MPNGVIIDFPGTDNPCICCKCGYREALLEEEKVLSFPGVTRSENISFTTRRALKKNIKSTTSPEQLISMCEASGVRIHLDGTQEITLSGNIDSLCRQTRSRISLIVSQNRAFFQERYLNEIADIG